MDLHDVIRLNRYWRENPPLTMLVRAIAQALGVTITPPDTSHHMTAEEAMRMMAQTGGRIEGIGSM